MSTRLRTTTRISRQCSTARRTHLCRISSLAQHRPHPASPISRRSHSLLAARRPFSTTSRRFLEPAPLSQDDYHEISDTYMDALVERLEALQEGSRPELDVEYSAGVLNIVVPGAGTYVVNKQPPNKQIWLSSPISGPKRYDWVLDGQEGRWVYLRDGSSLSTLLLEEVGVDMAS